MSQGYRLLCCSGCAVPRPFPVGHCPACGSLQTLLMAPGTQRAVAESYHIRLLAQARPLLPSDIPLTRKGRRAEMDQFFGKEGE